MKICLRLLVNSHGVWLYAFAKHIVLVDESRHEVSAKLET